MSELYDSLTAFTRVLQDLNDSSFTPCAVIKGALGETLNAENTQ